MSLRQAHLRARDRQVRSRALKEGHKASDRLCEHGVVLGGAVSSRRKTTGPSFLTMRQGPAQREPRGPSLTDGGIRLITREPIVGEKATLEALL